MSYLLNYNPGTPQYTYPRRGGAKLSGTAIIHTAECAMDLDGDDQSAEICASFIANRADYGSYHRLVDSDSIIDMVPWEYEAWQDSETNNWAIGISAAVQAGKWHIIPAPRRDRIYRNLAACAADFVRHMAGKGVTVPLVRITGAQARNRVAGFCAHGDSGLHRSDPGTQFDWALFFNYTAEALGGITAQGSISPIQEDDMFSDSDRAALARIDSKVDPLPSGGYWADMIGAMARVDQRTWEAPGKQYWSDLIDAMARVDSAATGADPQALATAIAEALPKADAEALVDALAARLLAK